MTHSTTADIITAGKSALQTELADHIGAGAGDGSGTSAGTGCNRGGAGSGCHRVRGDHPIDVPFAICEANDVE